jgi:hypothetical protein
MKAGERAQHTSTARSKSNLGRAGRLEVNMRPGILRKGFTIQTPTIYFRIPKNTKVFFHSSTPRITFEGFEEVVLFREDKQWYASIYGTLFAVLYEIEKPPYPISYFKK